MTEFKKGYILPLGSVVTLKHGGAQIMVAGRAQLFNNGGTIGYFDYAALPFPQGIVDTNQYAFFNDEDIENIIFEGYRSDEEIEYENEYNRKVLNSEYPKLYLEFEREQQNKDKQNENTSFGF